MTENILINKYLTAVCVLFILGFGVKADELLSVEERIVMLTILGESENQGFMGMYVAARRIEQVASERNLRPAWACAMSAEFKCWSKYKNMKLAEAVPKMQKAWLKPKFDKNGTLVRDDRHTYARELSKVLVSGKSLQKDN